ncbi:hypothetical protein K3495_g3016 [Podosphaera aphanis]|nr:hypothetical protein K3495_g3016 [Podosphaera aphanis]
MGQEQSSLETIQRHEYRQSAPKSNSYRNHDEKNILVNPPASKVNRNECAVQDIRESCGPSSLTDTTMKGTKTNTTPALTSKKKRLTISQPQGKAGRPENFPRASLKSYFSSWSDHPKRFSSNSAFAEAVSQTQQSSRSDTQNLDIILESPGTLSSEFHENGLNSNTRSRTRSYMSMRPSSLRQPAIATRAAVDVRKDNADHGLHTYQLPQIPLSSSGREHIRDDSQSSFLQFQNHGLQPQRTETPSDLEHGHIGAFKLGTLRITNGAASPAPSREHGQEDKRDLLSNQKRCFQEQHNKTLSSDISKSWDDSRESSLRQIQGRESQSSGTPLRHPNFDFESSDTHEIIIPSKVKPLQLLEIHDDSILSEELTPFSFFDSPIISPTMKEMNIHIAVRDKLFDEEPWTPSINTITKSVHLQKSTLSKADSGYRSNDSSQLSENELIPKVKEAEGAGALKTRVISGSFSFTSSVKSKDNEIIKTVEKNFASPFLQVTNEKNHNDRPKLSHHDVGEKMKEPAQQDHGVPDTSVFQIQSVKQTDSNRAFAPTNISSLKLTRNNDLQFSTASYLPAPQLEKDIPYTPRESSKTFFLDTTPPPSSRIFKSNNSEACEDERKFVPGEKKNASSKDSGCMATRSGDDKQPASLISLTKISTMSPNQKSPKKKVHDSFLDSKVVDMPRTPSLTNSVHTFTTEAIVTPETHQKIHTMQQESFEFLDSVFLEKNEPFAINLASIPQSDVLRAQTQPLKSHAKSSSPTTPTPLTLSESPKFFEKYINTNGISSPEIFNSNIEELDKLRCPPEIIPSGSQTPPPLVPPQSKRRVSYIPSPLKPEKNQSLSGIRQRHSLSDGILGENSEKTAIMSRDSIGKATQFQTLCMPYNQNKTGRIQDKNAETHMTNEIFQKAALTSSSVSNLVASLQVKEKSLANKTDITLERPTVRKIILYSEDPIKADDMPSTPRVRLKTKESISVKKSSKNPDLSIDVQKASFRTQCCSIQVLNTHQNFAESSARSTTSKSMDEPESKPHHIQENNDQGKNRELPQRSVSTSRAFHEKVLPANEDTSGNLPSARTLSTPVRYRRPPLTPPPSSSLKISRLFSARNVEQQSLEKTYETPTPASASNYNLNSNNFPAPVAQKKTAPVVIVPAKSSNPLRRSKASYPPQAHANRHSQMMFNRTSPPPIPKIADFYSQIENTQKQMEKIQMPQIQSQHSPSLTLKLKEKKEVFLPKTLQKSLSSNSAKTSRVNNQRVLNGEVIDRPRNLIAQQQLQQQPLNPTTSVNSRSSSGSQSIKSGMSSISGLGAQFTHHFLAKSGDQRTHALESVSLDSNISSEANADKNQQNDMEHTDRKSLYVKAPQDSSTSKISGANYPVPSSGIVRKSKPQNLILQSKLRSIETQQNISHQPTLRPKFLHQNSIDSLPSQRGFNSKVHASEPSPQEVPCTPILSSSPHSSSELRPGENTDFSPIISPRPEVKSEGHWCAVKESKILKLINLETASASLKPDSVVTSIPTLQVSSAEKSVSLNSLNSPRLELSGIDTDLEQKAICKAAVKNAAQRTPIPIKTFSSIDTLPSQRNRLRYTSIDMPAQKLSSENQEVNHGAIEAPTRSHTPKESEIIEPHSLATIAPDYSFPGQIRAPGNQSFQGSSPRSPNNFPSIPKSINTYYQPQALQPSDLYPQSQSQTHILYHSGTGKTSRSPSIPISTATSFMTCPEDREIVVLAAGWR